MLVRDIGIRDVYVIEDISIKKVLSVLVKSSYIIIKPQQPHYDSLEVDQFWTYVGNKSNKVWFYVYHKSRGSDCNSTKNGSFSVCVFTCIITEK